MAKRFRHGFCFLIFSVVESFIFMFHVYLQVPPDCVAQTMQ